MRNLHEIPPDDIVCGRTASKKANVVEAVLPIIKMVAEGISVASGVTEPGKVIMTCPKCGTRHVVPVEAVKVKCLKCNTLIYGE